jgi:exosortase family protein XrtF
VTDNSRRLTRFVLTAAALYIAWHLFYTRLIHEGSAGFAYDVALCSHIAHASAGLLQTIGFESFNKATYVYLNSWHVVSVGWQCDGLSLMALFAGFIVAYPGPWRPKLWFIPAGILMIHALNIVRVAALALNQVYARSSMEFNHHYTFTILIYAFIFWLWTIWVRRFANRFSLTGNTPPEGTRDAESASAISS